MVKLIHIIYIWCFYNGFYIYIYIYIYILNKKGKIYIYIHYFVHKTDSFGLLVTRFGSAHCI